MNQSYQRVIEQRLDGSYVDDTVWTTIDSQQFITSIDFNLFSDSNLQETQLEHSFDSGGNTLAWWMTTFFFEPQSIETPFQDELLGLANFSDYADIWEQYIIFAAGTYHYYDPQDDSDVREDIVFRREVTGYTVTETDEGRLQDGFSYWQQFTIDLPSPLSFDQRSTFNSYSVDDILKSFSGSSVRFETYYAKRNWWSSSDFSEMNYKFTENGYTGYGTFSYSNVSQVSAPSALSLLIPFMLLCFSSLKRRK